MNCLITFLMGQKQAAHWFFGTNGGLDFNSGTPVEKKGALRTLEGSASISDGNGNLLFYTDGITVYNANHEVMLNGRELYGDTTSTQSAIIIPNPINFREYYIFTVDATSLDGTIFDENPEKEDLINGVNYSVVDIFLDKGLGKVTDQKNIHLLDYSAEKLTAIKIINKNVFWVIIFSNANNGESKNKKFDTFYAYKIDENGVNNPIKSTLEIFSEETTDHRGYMKISPDGSKIICNSQSNRALLVDFDIETGIVSNPFILQMEDDIKHEDVYGAEFSPSGQYLYIDAFFDTDEGYPIIDNFNILGNNRKLYQFDVSATDINGSRKLIDQSVDFRGALQLAMDGKIYRVLSKGYLYDSARTLGVINYPDNEAATVDYNPEAIVLQEGYVTQGLPPFIQSFFLAQIAVEDHCFGELTSFEIFFTEQFKSIIWDFGDPTTTDDTSTDIRPTYTYSTPGTYKVTAEITLLNDSKEVYEKEFTIYENPEVTIQTTYDHYFLWQEFDLKAEIQSGNKNNFMYHWKGPNGFTSTDLNPVVKINGMIQNIDYSVIVTNEFGCEGNAQKVITVHEDVESRLGEDRKHCDGQNLTIGYPEKIGFTYLWNDGVKTHEREITESGTYTLTVTTPDGNQDTGSIEVIIVPPITLEIQSAFTNYFYGDTIKFSPLTNINDNLYYRWSGPNNFSSNNEIAEIFIKGEQNQGAYILYLEEVVVGCNKIANKNINTFIDVETALGEDAHLCYGETVTYSYPLEAGFTYLWDDGITSNQREITAAGTYTLTVTTPDGNSNTGSVTVTKTDLAIEKVETCYHQLFVSPQGGTAPYEYSLDGMNYQSSPLFTNILQGFHKIYVKDAKGCIVKTQGDYFVAFNLYQAFSPNGDNINDYWDLSALNGCRNIDVKIFDRYGKFLHQMNAGQLIWDGRVKGKPVPSNTYWFIIEFNDDRTPILKGHVTIKRVKD